MDYEDIKQAFFVNQPHDTILYSTPLEASPLAKLISGYDIDNLFDEGLTENELRTFGGGFCPVFILGSDLIFDKDYSAVEALTYLLQNEIEEQIGYQACLFLIPPDFLEDIKTTFLQSLGQQRDVLISTKDDNHGYYTDMKRIEVLSYAFFRTTPLPKGSFRLR